MCIKAFVLFMSRIVVNIVTEFHKIIFRKLEKDLNCFTTVHVIIIITTNPVI